MGIDRSISQMGAEFNERPVINVAIRRSHLYEDAFEKISPNNGKAVVNVLFISGFTCVIMIEYLSSPLP